MLAGTIGLQMMVMWKIATKEHSDIRNHKKDGAEQKHHLDHRFCEAGDNDDN